jgi:hypothetical protein
MQCHSEALSDVDYIHAGAELTCELLLGAVEGPLHQHLVDPFLLARSRTGLNECN